MRAQEHGSHALGPRRANSPLLVFQLPGDPAPPAADAHCSNLQQSCPDQHLCSGTSSLLPISPTSTISCDASILTRPLPGYTVFPSLMSRPPLCSLLALSPQPKCPLASSQILLFSLALIILPSFSPFQGLPEAGPEDYQPHGGERQQQGGVLFFRTVKWWEVGPILPRIPDPREHSTTTLCPLPHSDFQNYLDSQGHDRESGDPRGRVQLQEAIWGQGRKWLNKDTA